MNSPPFYQLNYAGLNFGGADRNRTGVQGFAVLCVATPPPRQDKFRRAFRQIKKTSNGHTMKREGGETRRCKGNGQAAPGMAGPALSSPLSRPINSGLEPSFRRGPMMDFDLARLHRVDSQFRRTRVTYEPILAAIGGPPG